MSRPAVISPFSRSAEEDAPGRDLPLSCRTAATPEELAIHFAVRDAVFVREQGFFEGTDRDAHDEEPETIHVLGLCGQVAGGAVRLYPLEDPGLWKGDRLAVLPAFRRRGLGAPLVRFAVRTAGERGGRLMVAYIQPQNVGFFERLGWHRVGELAPFVGRIHQQMAINLQGAAAGS
ncbi:MAG: MSMEG_0567/Sll0786 family nitrogen starvation N-acetyltransferase [Actinomycetota bacterium]